MHARNLWPFLPLALSLASACGGESGLSPSEDAGVDAKDAGDDRDLGEGEGDGTGNAIDPSRVPGIPGGRGSGLFPQVAHSGFDGTNTYQVMFVREATTPVRWSISPADAATVRTSTRADGGPTVSVAILTTRKTGTFEVISEANGQTSKGLLEVEAYTPEQAAAGKARYREAGTGRRQACAFCHEGEGGVRHEPLALAFFDDTAILSAVLNGNYPGGSGQIFGVPHQWELTEAERAGIVPYLRSLPVSGF